MGRPEPCVLFSQTFVHTHLDEYVDEVLFAEPVVITACEFLEQNASSVSQAVSLVGATSPPSFALEVFVQCEGETRFRRLCQPFLYTHSSSNVLEVEAVVTNHLVVRGSYRSLSLVIYGNTAEDLGQFNIEFDDSSLTDLVSSADGKLEDLPLALRTINRTFEESLCSLNVLSLPVVTLDLSVEVKQLLHLMLKILELANLDYTVHKVVSTVGLAASSLVTFDIDSNAINQKHLMLGRDKDFKESDSGISEAKKELLELYEALQSKSMLGSSEMECSFMESDADLASSKQLVEMLLPYFHFNRSSGFGHQQLSESNNVTLGLNVALLLCSSKESCFHFVNCGGMDQLAYLFDHEMQKSTAITVLLLGVIEQATRHSVGCEGFLGWWPREDDNIPSGTSDGYSHLLKLLLQKPRHDLASLATYVLHRLRFYEVVSRYESEVLSILGGLSANVKGTNDSKIKLVGVGSLLRKLLNLLNSHGPIEDPSPVAHASRVLILGQTDGLVSYKATSGLIASSNCCFSNWEIDSHLLALLKERGFLPLSAALLSTTILHSEAEDVVDISMDIVSSIGSIILSLLFCRSGLVFLLHQPELTATLIHALKGPDAMNKEECVPLRYASVLISKGFTCSPQEVGIIVETHLRVVSAIDRLLSSTPQSEEFLWVLWELCGLARSDCGRQALLALSFFPEVVSVLIEALHSVKETDPAIKNSGASPLNLAILHSAAEIVEVIVTDSTATSLSSWIGHAMELHKALHSSSPGSNRKDAPTRLLEWIDAGLVYHKNGAIGLLRYAAVLASGGDAHLTSTNILVSDLTDAVDNVIGEASNASEINVMENIASIISLKSFEGLSLRDSSIAQLTTAFRILSFISENPIVAASLYDEGAVAVIYVVLVNCSLMLERSSNSYDYLVDEGTECNSTSDLLLERNREQCLVDLLVPSLVLLITLLQKLQEAKEQHRNTKLMNALLRLHREVSPKLAACAADLSSPYPDSALGFEAVCHLVVSALAYWPVCGWTPGLFHSILASVQATSSLALGPKETCSLLCLLNDLFPEEGVWLWKNGMPLLSGLRSLAIGTLLGPHKEKQVDWYLEHGHLEKLLNQLMPQLDKIAEIIQHYAISALVVIQDMLRVFIIRIACQKAEHASKLLKPILSWIRDHTSDSSPSDTDAYKAYRFLDFLASLLEHPNAKVLLFGEGFSQILRRVLDSCIVAMDSDGGQISDYRNSSNFGFTMISWCIPVFQSISLLCNSRTMTPYNGRQDILSTKDCSIFIHQLLKFCQVLPVGKELASCLAAFKDLGSCSEGRSALMSALLYSSSLDYGVFDSESGHEKNVNLHFLNESEWRKSPPLLCCWKKLLRSVDSKEFSTTYAIEAVNTLSLGSLSFCMDGKSLNVNAVVALKFLFGLPDDMTGISDFPEENINYIQEFSTLLSSRTSDDDYQSPSDMRITMFQVSESVKSLLSLFQKSTDAVKVDDSILFENLSLSQNDVQVPSRINQMTRGVYEKADEDLYLGGLEDRFAWELPETLPDRLSQAALPTRRKVQPADSSTRRARGDNSSTEITNSNTFSRGLGPTTAPAGTTRRDTFRQRKPNTSRPPSMHVDDYVARERSVDGASNSNVIAVQRLGSSGGRPPSIHVDEFMARQRERQNPAASAAETAAQSKNAAAVSGTDNEKVNKSKQLKTDLDDDLQGIDIVFDAEESETDDKLPFPQPDDNLQQPAPVIVEQSSPHSVVEETESDVNGSSQFSHMGTPLGSNVDDNAQSEFSSRMSVSRPEMPLTREPSVSSDKNFFEQSEDSKNAMPIKNSSGYDSAGANSSAFSAPVYSNTPATLAQLPADSRINRQNFYPKSSPQYASNIPVGSRGIYEQKVLSNQPPLPPMPPPSTISPVSYHTTCFMLLHKLTAFLVKENIFLTSLG
ncbi:Protein virilizer, partial [Corchorus capsularis]